MNYRRPIAWLFRRWLTVCVDCGRFALRCDSRYSKRI